LSESRLFLDESSINSGMTPLCGWGETSERVDDYVPDLRFKRASIIAALSSEGFNAPMTFVSSPFRGFLKRVKLRG
jgi:hypothetical protein